MYCINCGHKLNKNNNYCTECGYKTNNITETKPNNNNNYIPLIIGIISLIGAFIINIIILPIAIFGIIISIKYKKKPETILNIIACLIAVFIFSTLALITISTFNYFKESNNNYKENRNYNYHNNYRNNNTIDISGTWYLYINGTINHDDYYKFDNNKTFVYKKENEIYTGTYYLNKNSSLYNSYHLILNVFSITKNDGTIITNELEKISYTVTLNDTVLKLKNNNTNEEQSLKKDIVTIY